MSLKWTGSHSESGILRKCETKEKREELFVFGYSCKLFREDDKAQHIDQGKHLIPWMGDESLKIDRYDARGALHDLSQLEAPPGGFDWRVELTRNELEVEQLCDEERYRALHTDEDEEEMYKEEELKRLHAAGYGQVSFNYENSVQPPPASQTVEFDEPFIPTEAFMALLPPEVVLPESVKLNAIIEKTAKFIASQGAQMEILIKAKQRDNPQFQFLNKDSSLHPYYTNLIDLVKAGKWPEKKIEPVEVKPPETEEYLHPSLASTIIEAAPSIPSIHYKPSADCDYTMLISKMRGEPILDEAYVPELAPGELPPPGTEPLPLRSNAQISRAPVMYNAGQAPEYTAAPPVLYQAYQYGYQAPIPPPPATITTPPIPTPVVPPQPKKSLRSTGLSLMKHYNTDSDSDVSDFDDASSTDSTNKPTLVTPPADVQVIIDKMAGYVARNGADFENIVRAKNDTRFTFLEPDNVYHEYYRKLMQQKRGEYGKLDDDKSKPTVSFSIKKMKEPETILPKPALPYESSSDDESGTKHKQTDESMDTQTTNIPQITTNNKDMPPVVVYKMQGTQSNNLPIVQAIEAKPKENTNIIKPIINNIIKPITNNMIPPENINNVTQKIDAIVEKPEKYKEETKKEKSPTPDKKERDKAKNDSDYKKERKRHKDRKKDRDHDRKKSEKEYRKERSENVDRRRERESSRKERDSDRHKKIHNEVENEIITLEENSDELIDLTGDLSDSKGGGSETEAERARKLARRQRAAEFLRRAGVEPCNLPAGSLASAMVDTLETIRKKKEQEKEKRRRHEKRRHKDKRGFEDGYDRSHRKSKRRKYSDEESDSDSGKKRKRRKEKPPSKSKNKRASSNDLFEEAEMPVTIDIVSTLKELRNNSPTKDLVGDIEESSFTKESTDSENEASPKRKSRKDREYSEGEWSSDSGGDTESSKGD